MRWFFMPLGVASVLAAMGCSSDPNVNAAREDSVRLTSNDGSFEIVTTGPRRDPTAATIANQVQLLDADAQRWEGTLRDIDPELAAALKTMAQQYRDDAVDGLHLAYRIAERTSGPLDSKLLAQAREDAQQALQLRSQKPSSYSLFVRTNVGTSVEDAAIHYATMAERRSSLLVNWQSYTPGQLMRIGRYVFRITALGPHVDYEEVLPVIADPTSRMITPTFGADR